MESEFVIGVFALEDGRIVRLDEEGLFELVDGIWTEPTAPYHGMILGNHRLFVKVNWTA